MNRRYRIIVILIIIPFIIGFSVSRYISNKNCDKCTQNAINAAKGYYGNLKLGIYSISKVTNSDVEEVGEDYYNNIGFEFKENNIVYVTDIEETYMTGTYKIEGNSIVCTINELYIMTDNEEGDEYKKISDNSTLKLEIEKDDILKIVEGKAESDEYTNSHIVGNEYKYDVLLSN